MYLLREQKILLDLLKNSINNFEVSINNSSVDFDKLFEIANSHSVNMLAYESTKLLTEKLPEKVNFDWVYYASRKMTKNEEVMSVHKKLTALLEKNNIKYFVFKGLCSASYYKKTELRELGDIDFYVSPDDFEKADETLKCNGFKLIDNKTSKHWLYKFNDVELEMHYEFWDMPDNSCSVFLDDLLKTSVDSPYRYNINEYSFYGPNPVTHSVILIMHIINHLQHGGIGLRHLCDFAAFVSSDDFIKNYDEIIDCYKKGGLIKTAQIVVRICCDYLGTDSFEFSNNSDDELVDLFLTDILTSGNFGRLSEDSYYGSSLFTIKKSENSGFLKSLFSFCKLAWPTCEKHKILLPIAPFFIGTRYFFRMISGKRPKINPVKYVKNGVSRSNLYKKLDFYKENNNVTY